MPATTRSSTRYFRAAAAAIVNTPVNINTSEMIGQGKMRGFDDLVAVNNNKKWSVKDQNTLIRMCRQTEMTPDIMAATLGRSEEAIRYRLAKIIHEHLDGRTDEASIKEVANWLLPN